MIKMDRIKKYRSLGFVMAGLLFGGCLTKADRPLRIGTSLWPGYEPFFLARDLRYFEPAPIKLVEFSSSTEVIRALRSQVIEAGCLTLDEALLLRNQGLEIDIALVLDISHGGDVIIAKPDILSMKNLRGRRIAVENTSLGAFVLARALQLSGLDISDVTLVPAAANEHEAIFRAGKVDAVVTFEPHKTRIVNRGGRLLFDSTQIPNEIVDVLVVRSDIASQRRTSVRGIIGAWFKSLDYLAQRPDDGIRRIAARMQVSHEEALLAYMGLRIPTKEENRNMLSIPKPPLLDTARKLQSIMMRGNLLSSDFPATELFDSKLWEEL